MKKSKEEVASHLFFYLDHHFPTDPMLGVEILTNLLFAHISFHSEKGNLSEVEAYRGVVANVLNYVHEHEIPVPGLKVTRMGGVQ